MVTKYRLYFKINNKTIILLREYESLKIAKEAYPLMLLIGNHAKIKLRDDITLYLESFNDKSKKILKHNSIIF